MLVLTRRVGEAIHIYPSENMDPSMTVGELFAEGPLTVTLTRINGAQARIGIVAPEALAIAREEVSEKSA